MYDFIKEEINTCLIDVFKDDPWEDTSVHVHNSDMRKNAIFLRISPTSRTAAKKTGESIICIKLNRLSIVERTEVYGNNMMYVYLNCSHERLSYHALKCLLLGTSLLDGFNYSTNI